MERYHCKLNFQSTSSKLSKANISLVVRVGANDNVKLILVFTFKAASVSSAKLLSVLRTCHTRNNNWIQRSPPILLLSHSFLKSTRWSRRPPHLHTSSENNLRNFTRSDGYKMSRTPSCISLFPRSVSEQCTHKVALKVSPQLRFHDFRHRYQVKCIKTLLN